jgi:transposase
MARPYARAPKGQRIYAAVPVNTGKNLTVLAALSLVGIVEAMTIAGSSEGIQEAIEAVGASLEYLPPYSPDLSPIEACWSKLKTILRAKAARTSAHLDQAITEAFNLITPQDARGWFAHCGYV